MSDTYTDIQQIGEDEDMQLFGEFHAYQLENITPTKHIEKKIGKEYLEELISESRSSTDISRYRYLLKLISFLDYKDLPF